MVLKIVAKKVKVTDEIQSFADKKVNKVAKYFEDDTEFRLTLWEERGKQIAEGTIHAKGTIFRAQEATDGFVNAIEKIIMAIERQIAKNKTRLAKKLRSGSLANMHVESLVDVVEEKEFVIVKTKRFGVKPMSVEEAILQMNLLEHSFFVYQDANSDEKSIVYKRKDGNYGLIELE